jgi:hypothetical protein
MGVARVRKERKEDEPKDSQALASWHPTEWMNSPRLQNRIRTPSQP